MNTSVIFSLIGVLAIWLLPALIYLFSENSLDDFSSLPKVEKGIVVFIITFPILNWAVLWYCWRELRRNSLKR